MKVWITKYALTQGIFVIDAEIADTCPTMVCRLNTRYADYYHKPFWHTTEAEARAHAEQLRQAKIRSVKKQLAKLEKLSFANS